jgi:hypothetical protein
LGAKTIQRRSNKARNRLAYDSCFFSRLENL